MRTAAMSWLLVTVIALAGCADRAEPRGRNRQNTDPEPRSASCIAMPSSVSLPFSPLFRSDEFYASPTGEVRRKVTVQYVAEPDGDPAGQLEQVLLSAGFTRAPSTTEDSLFFTRPDDEGNVTVTVTPLEAGEAVPVAGSVTFDLPRSSWHREDRARCPRPQNAKLLRLGTP